MAIFGGGGKYAAKKSKKSIIAVFALIVLVAFLTTLVIYLVSCNKQKDNNDETKAPTTTIIQNDPHLGEIEIPVVKDMEINEYNNDNFSVDENGFMTYTENGIVTSSVGIDLSEFQGDVDFYAVKEQGVEFVILKLGGRGYGQTGTLYADSRFSQYYEQAKAAGLEVGAYFFSQATNEQEAKEEAQYAIDLLDGATLDYPLAYDWEFIENEPEARTNGVTKETLTECTVAFCKTVKMSGYKPMIYINSSLIYTNFILEEIKDYDFWHAEYTNTPSLYYNFTIWQYSDSGSVNGIDGNVDLNISFKKY